MLNLLHLAIFILFSPEMGTFSQTTNVYDEQYNIQEEFMQLIGDSKNDVVSQGAEFISSAIKNRTRESLPPMTLSRYCLLQTIWALASDNVELAETFVNKTVLCYDSTSEEWLETFQFDPSLVFGLVKSTSKINEGNILEKIAISLSRNYNILIKASQIGDDSLIIWLKKAGLDFAQIGNKAIASAWVEDHIDTVSLLLAMGALDNNSARDVVCINNSRGETLLHFAAGRGLIFLAKKLLKDGATVDQKDVDSLTPLYHAVRANEKGMVRLLLQRGADLLTRSQSGNTLLHLAVIENSTVALSGLLEFGLEIQTGNYEEIPPLFLAAERGYNSLMDLLIKRGADANFKTSSGNGLLHIAVNIGSLIAVKNLIKHGASIDSKNSQDLTPLYVAANVENSDLIWFLLNKGATLHDSMSGDSLLHIAARRGDTKAIESLVNFCIPVDKLNEKGLTPLYSAASAGKRSAMELLLSKGADLYITLSKGQRLLHVAAVEGNVVAIESLLNLGIYVDVKDTDILTALCRAVQNDNIVSVALLIEKGANTSFRTTNGNTLLHIAVVSNSYESIQLLVEHGLSVNAENKLNETPLYLAAKNNNTNTTKLLITLGADMNYVTTKGGTLAHLAAVTKDFVALKTLFDIGVDFNAIDKEGYTPLYTVIRKSEVMTNFIANFMLEIGVDLFFIDLHNDSLLHIAARNKDHKAIDFLIDRGIYIDSQSSNGSRPVDVALYNGNCDTARYLIKKGANIRGRNRINATLLHSVVIGDCNSFLERIAIHIDSIDPKDQNMQTPLHLAAVLGRTAISDTLIFLGADVNSVDKYNSTPFQIAAVNQHWDIVSLFLKKDVNLDWTDAHERTLLHLATLEDREDIVKYLSKQMRVDIYVQDINGRIPLHLAAEKGWYNLMSYLTDERVPKSIDYRDREEKTPLHLAAIGGHESAVKYLLGKGADHQATDRHRQTPLIYAAKHHNWNITRLLLNITCTLSGSSSNDTDEKNRTLLHLAVLDGELDVISSYKECLKKIINNKDYKEQTPLDLAVSMEDLDIVTYLFENYKYDLMLEDCIALKLAKVGFWDIVGSLPATEVGSKCRDEKNRTLLHLAALYGDEITVLSLLDIKTTDVDARDVDNRTPLHLAAIENRHAIVRMLLEHDARKDIQDWDHTTPLTIALTNNGWDSVLELLKNETDVRLTDVYNRTLLHYAAINGQKEIIEYLLKNTKIDINAKDVNLDTPLQLLAAQSNLSSHDRQDIMNRFVLNGADWSLLDKQKRNIVHLVTTSGDEETLKYILDRYRLDINSQDINSQTPLHIAIIDGHYNIVGTLLRYGADRDVLDINHFTPIVYAIMKRVDAVDLLDPLTDVNWSDTYNRSLLHLAAMNGCSRVVRKLLTQNIKKINIDLLDINEQTPLHLAAREEDSGIVDLLLQAGANGYHLDKENRSPLNLAVINKSWEVVKTLVIRGYYKEYVYDGNRTLLHLAIMNGLRDLIDYLINNEISDLTATDKFGDTPLHIAAHKNDLVTVQQLLYNRVEKDVLNGIGQRPLMVAMVSNSWEAVDALLKGNCNVEGVDGKNRTLLHLAAMNGKKKIIDHLFSCRNVDINAMDSNHETPLDLLLNNRTIISFYRSFFLVDKQPIFMTHCTFDYNSQQNTFKYDYNDINWRDGRGRTFLHRVLLSPYICFEDFLGPFGERYGFGTIDAVDNKRQTPLHSASMRDEFHYTEQLIEFGANINAVEINGHSLLHLAAMNGHKSVIEWLLTKYTRYEDDFRPYILVDLRINARDLLGRTPLQLSLDYGHEEIAKLLKEYVATI